MKALLGGVFVGLLAAGVVAGIVVPLLPVDARGPWVVRGLAGALVAVSVYLARRLAKTPSGNVAGDGRDPSSRNDS